MRGPSFWCLVLLVVLSPIPFGSARPVWMDLISVLVGLGLLSYAVQRWRLGRPMPLADLPRSLWIAGALVGVVVIWALLQALPALAALTGWAHPAWGEAARALPASDLPATISLVPERTLAAVGTWVTWIGLALLIALHARRERNATLLLTVFVAVQGVCAAYGLAMVLSGLDLVLWFEKEAYFGTVTGPFINRNSYATYAGLGVLAALALLLRHVRRVADGDAALRTRVLMAVEDGLWSQGVLPVAVIAVGTVALLLTESRMGLVAFCAGTVAFLGLWMARMRPGLRRVGLALVGGVVVLLTVNVMLSADGTLSRFATVETDADTGRFAVYPLMVEAIQDRPWLGHGLGTFESAFRLYRDDTVTKFLYRGHSDWLELPMDLGLPAAGLVFVALLLLTARGARGVARAREPERPVLAVAAAVLVGVHATMDFSLQIPAVMIAFLLLLVSGLTVRAHRPPGRCPRVRGGVGSPRFPDEDEPRGPERRRHQPEHDLHDPPGGHKLAEIGRLAVP
ncbi:hypothetical protein GHC57_04955 [Roseospira navarrensis]|uniref:O-antigen ligase-related domain-containing protein n=1 Tax=Roseospira navarrensis TaxID=140058 RepID=A0A7X1ZC65_9PROT|nr:O-antigen ligase family protein [Roseospira navarrensis]MQX35864.1 hypothetical protein [Roseospira navarrensis]